MNEILGVQIPADLSVLSADELATLRADLKAAAETALAGDVTPQVITDVRAAREQRDAAKTVLSDRAAAEAALSADLEAERAALADEEDAEGEGPGHGEDEDGEGEAEGEDAPADEADADKALVASAGYTPVVRAAGFAGGTAVVTPDAVIPPTERRSIGDLVALGHLNAASGLSHIAPGEKFETMTSLGDALYERWQDVAGGSEGGHGPTVARIPGNFGALQTLGENAEDNIQVLGGRDFRAPSAQKAITAAMCAPVEPYYGLGAMSSTDRPVRGSMPAYRAPRGGVTVYPTPRLSDVDDGVGIWTRSDDANGSATKTACAVIPCASSVQYDIYAIYRCLTVKNLLQLTFPELVEAYLNRLAALQARLAEVTLLDAMVGSVNTKNVTVTGTVFDASIDLWTTIENALCVYREEERYGSETLHMWAARWVRSAIKIGLMRQRRTQGKLSDRLPTDAEVDAALGNLGVNVTWTLDTATTWDAVAAQADNAALVALPLTADFLLSPEGNFRVLDEGNINLGVTNNIVRDNTSNSKNQFTMWYENVEGLIDFGAISYAVELRGFCPNGAQTGDVTAINCGATS